MASSPAFLGCVNLVTEHLSSEPMRSLCVKWGQSWPPHTLSKINWNRKVQADRSH